MQDLVPVLSFAEARLAIDPAGGLTAPISLALAPGAMVLADLRGPKRREGFADAVVGLNPPQGGSVLFQGRNWAEMDPERAAAMRGRIGRLFCGLGWISELTVAENILLPSLYHTARPERALREEAARLARRFGLPGLPITRPDLLAEEDLHRAGLVRAFLNDPALVVLEEPLDSGGESLLEPLMEAVRAVRDRGGAVLWLTQGPSTLLDRLLPCSQRFRLVHAALLPLGSRAAAAPDGAEELAHASGIEG